jgi:hypothetical protein
MYIAIDVWKRVDSQTLIRFRCFQVLPQNKYVVQSADFYRLPLDEARVNELERQFLELFFEEAPEVRAEMSETLEEAVRKHVQEFREFQAGETRSGR